MAELKMDITKMADGFVKIAKERGIFLSRWIPVKYHQATDEEIEENGYPFDICFILDCLMPDDEQEILVTVKHINKRTGETTYYVAKDVCYLGDGYTLESGRDWITDIAAWQLLPQPYKAESEGIEC